MEFLRTTQIQTFSDTISLPGTEMETELGFVFTNPPACQHYPQVLVGTVGQKIPESHPIKVKCLDASVSGSVSESVGH